jgi:hypothetical protein
MTGDQTAKALRLLCALQRATEHLSGMSEKEILDRGISEKDRIGAKIGLELAKRQLSEPTKSRHDLGTSVLLGYLDEREKPRVAKVLKDAVLLKLSHFGHRSWGRIDAAFKDAGVPCPLAFTVFHAAYQEVLDTIRNPPRDSTTVVGKKTTAPISFADMG